MAKHHNLRGIIELRNECKKITVIKSLSYSLCKLQKDIVEDTIKKQLKYRGKNG